MLHIKAFEMPFDTSIVTIQDIKKVSKGAMIMNRNNQILHLTQDTNGKVKNSQ